MSVVKCNICGRFRRDDQTIRVDYSDGRLEEIADECLTCTAPANLVHGETK